MGRLSVSQTDNNKLNIIDISDPSDPNLIGAVSTGYISEMSIRDGFAYI